MSQKLRIIQHKNPNNVKGIFISRKSIGTMWVGGVPYTYNANLVYDYPVTVEKIVEDSQPKKRRVIVIRRK